METHFALLVCCLLAFSSATMTTAPESGSWGSTIAVVPGKTEMSPTSFTPTSTSYTAPSSTDTTNLRTVSTTSSSTSTESTTPFSSTTSGPTKETGTKAISPTSTYHPSTLWTSTADSTSLATTTPSAGTLTVSVPATQTTVNHNLTDTTFRSTTQNSPTVVHSTAASRPSTTQGARLSNSEKNITIVFGVLLGVFAVGLLMYMFHIRKQRMQFSHQPLYDTEDTDGSTADDTLVISGGLYEGHPIFDNQPPTTTQQSQFRLEFISERGRVPTF